MAKYYPFDSNVYRQSPEFFRVCLRMEGEEGPYCPFRAKVKRYKDLILFLPSLLGAHSFLIPLLCAPCIHADSMENICLQTSLSQP